MENEVINIDQLFKDAAAKRLGQDLTKALLLIEDAFKDEEQEDE